MNWRSILEKIWNRESRDTTAATQVCDGVSERLSDYIDGALTQPELRAIDQHLESCAVCRNDLETLRTTVGMLRAMPAVSAPRSFAIRPSAESATSPGGIWALLSTRNLGAATALAGLAFAVALAANVSGLPQSTEYSRAAPRDSSPVAQSKRPVAEPALSTASEAPPATSLAQSVPRSPGSGTAPASAAGSAAGAGGPAESPPSAATASGVTTEKSTVPAAAPTRAPAVAAAPQAPPPVASGDRSALPSAQVAATAAVPAAAESAREAPRVATAPAVAKPASVQSDKSATREDQPAQAPAPSGAVTAPEVGQGAATSEPFEARTSEAQSVDSVQVDGDTASAATEDGAERAGANSLVAALGAVVALLGLATLVSRIVRSPRRIHRSEDR